MMDNNRLQVIRESLRQSEELLRSQMAIALASDARALTFCGVLLASASILIGLANQSDLDAGMYAGAVMFYAAAVISGTNAMPVAWYAPGQQSADFAEDVRLDRPLDEVLVEMGTWNDKHIARNETIRRKQNRRLWLAAVVAVSAAPIGLLVELLASAR